jgi:hypothetical protein
LAVRDTEAPANFALGACLIGQRGHRIANFRIDLTPKMTDLRGAARWRSGYAEDCKSLHPSSILGRASTHILMTKKGRPKAAF